MRGRDLAEAFETAESLPALNALYRPFVRSAGFTAYALGYLPRHAAAQQLEAARRSPFLLLHWPQSWLELYAREGFVHDDIVVTEAGRATEPFTWADIRRAHPGASARVFAAAASYGWVDGLVIPLSQSDTPGAAPHATASLAGGSLDALDDASRTAIVTATRIVFDRAAWLAAQPQAPLAPGAKLSPREQQALRLCADGLSDGGIAGAMGIATTTAHFHVERAKRALGATTRAQAVAVALSRGLI